MAATEIDNNTGNVSASTGTGPFVIGAALKYHRSMTTVLPDGAVRTFFAIDPAGTNFMLFVGTYTADGTSLAVTSVINSSNGGNGLVNFTGATIEIAVVASKDEILGAPVTVSSTNPVTTDDTVGSVHINPTTGKIYVFTAA